MTVLTPERKVVVAPHHADILPVPPPPRLAWSATGKGSDTSLLALSTLVLWLLCFAVGAIGLAMSYAHPHPPAPALPPVQAEILNVELTNDPLPPPDAAPPPQNLPPPPPLPDTPTPPPQAPALTAVAEPSAAIAFPLPVAGPVQVVEPKAAAPARTVPEIQPAPPAPAPQKLVFGQGEGRQPGPQYPPLARRQGQEGVVGIRFTVGENGDVLAAEAVSPSPWPMLNREAVRTIRDRWQFQPGPMRLFEVAIRFELQK